MGRKTLALAILVLTVISAMAMANWSNYSSADNQLDLESTPTFVVGREYEDFKIHQADSFESANIPGMEFSVKDIDGESWIVANGAPTEPKEGKLILRTWNNLDDEGMECGGLEYIRINSVLGSDDTEYGSGYGSTPYWGTMSITVDKDLYDPYYTVEFNLMETGFRFQDDNPKEHDRSSSTDYTISDVQPSKTDQKLTLTIDPSSTARGMIQGWIAFENVSGSIWGSNIAFEFRIFLCQTMVFYKDQPMSRVIDFPSELRVDYVMYQHAVDNQLSNLGLSLSNYNNSISGTCSTLSSEGTRVYLELKHTGMIVEGDHQGTSFEDRDAYCFIIKVVEPYTVQIHHSGTLDYHHDDDMPYLLQTNSTDDVWLVPSSNSAQTGDYYFRMPVFSGSNKEFYYWQEKDLGDKVSQDNKTAIGGNAFFKEVAGYRIKEIRDRTVIERWVYAYDVIEQTIEFSYTDGTIPQGQPVISVLKNTFTQNDEPILRIEQVNSTSFKIVGDLIGVTTGGSMLIKVELGTYAPLTFEYDIKIRATPLENYAQYFNTNQEKRIQIPVLQATTTGIEYVYVMKNGDGGEMVFDSRNEHESSPYCEVSIHNNTESSQYSQSEKYLDITFKQAGLYLICVVISSNGEESTGYTRYNAYVYDDDYGSNLYIQSFKVIGDPFQYCFVAANAEKYPDTEVRWTFKDNLELEAFVELTQPTVYVSFEEKSNATITVTCQLVREIHGATDVVAEYVTQFNPDVPSEKETALIDHAYDYTIQDMPATSRIAITPEASWINISRTVQNNKLYYRLSGIPDDSISPGTRYTVTVVDQGVTKTSFNITVINEEANCDFSIDVTNYTLTITNNNTPNTGHVYRVNWGHGNLEDFNPAVKTMSHTYMSTISATVSVEVIAKTPSGGVSLHKYVLNDGAPINIGDDQDEPGIGLIIHPNGASTETIWESSAKHIEFPPCPYKWEGHKFLYYAEDSHNWSNRTYMPGDTIDPNSLEEVWCIWEEEKVSGLTSTQILMIIAVGLFIVLIIARL